MGRNIEFSTGQVHGEPVTPEELHATVHGLLKSTHPVFGRNGSLNINKEISKGNVDEQDITSLKTATESPQEVEGWDGSPFKRQPMNALRNYYHPDVAAGDCSGASRLILPHLPAGSRMIHLASDEGYGGGDDHFAVEVPTTEGPHVVDLTHRQFGTVYANGKPNDGAWTSKDAKDIPFPLVEPKDEYLNRDTIHEGFEGSRLVERSPKETQEYLNG